LPSLAPESTERLQPVPKISLIRRRIDLPQSGMLFCPSKFWVDSTQSELASAPNELFTCRCGQGCQPFQNRPLQGDAMVGENMIRFQVFLGSERTSRGT